MKVLALSILFGLVLSSSAVAGTVTRQCERIGSAYGPDAHACILRFTGQIVDGDATRVEEAILASPRVVETASFDSPGGNPFEALKISEVLNRYFVSFTTGTCYVGISCVVTNLGQTCASACAIAFLASNERYGTEVFLHRPTFPAQLFAGLTGARAQTVYEGTVDRLTAELRAHRVPDSVILLMMAIRSEELSKLPAAYPTESPWMEEWLTAKCGPTHAGVAVIGGNLLCKGDAVMAEARRIQHKSY